MNLNMSLLISLMFVVTKINTTEVQRTYIFRLLHSKKWGKDLLFQIYKLLLLQKIFLIYCKAL